MERADADLMVDVISDVVCPWCWIGKRRLEAALAQRGSDNVTVRWHPFQLNPDLPAEGVDRKSYLERKFGGPAAARDVYARVSEAGRSEGLSFDFERIARQPNTLDSHRLIAWAQQHQPVATDALVERLFAAYFVEGVDLGDRSELVRLAAEAGLDAAAAAQRLASTVGISEVVEADRRTRSMGITGVPFFIFNQRLAVSGAQPAAVLADAIAQSEQISAAS